ncbi:MAG: arylsulfatase A-like enzyme, partial [Planctomycetota bacterium]
EQLASAGYWSGAITTHIFLASKYGLDQGFSVYDDSLVADTLSESHKAVTSQRISDRGIAMMREHAQDEETPWFLWLHYFDPHNVYVPHDDFISEFGRKTPLDRYDCEIAFTDGHIARVLNTLEELGLEEDTVVVLTADHGEEFGDHGGTGHRKTLYNEVVRVPLIIRAPGIEPRRVRESVSCVDFLPTMLQLVDVAAPPALEGRSLVDGMNGQTLASRAILSELGKSRWDSLIEDNWKLLRHNGGESYYLYDLDSDPGEAHDLAATRTEQVASMSEALDALKMNGKRKATDFGVGKRVKLSKQEQETLQELGYAGDD